MASKTETTAASVQHELEMKVINKERDRKSLFKHYMEEEKILVTVSPFYAPYLGKNVMVSLQGIAVFVPANGKGYRIPKSFAAELFDAISKIDERQQKLNRMADVQQNLESSIGALKF